MAQRRQCWVRGLSSPGAAGLLDALGQSKLGSVSPGLADCCGCFLSCPGDMEKAVHTFGQMPNGLSGQFSFGRAQFPSEGSADLCDGLGTSWPVRHGAFAAPRSSQQAAPHRSWVEGLEAVKQCLRLRPTRLQRPA